MDRNANDVVIVSGARTAIGRAPKGGLRDVRPDDLAAVAISAALQRLPGLNPSTIDDVILGCASPELEQGLDVARIASLRAGLPETIPGLTINRFCASGLEAIAVGAAKLAAGQASVVISGGTESMSMVPFMGSTLRPNPYLAEHLPDTYLSMGLSVEGQSRQFDISRRHSDEYALESHQKAIAAQDTLRLSDEITPVTVTSERNSESDDSAVQLTFDRDEGPRRDTSIQALSSLRPAFLDDGIITAGNASPRSDGAAALVLTTREFAMEHGWRPLARFAGYAVVGVAPAQFGIAPAYAIPKLLDRSGLALRDIDLIEFNEAFAAQVLAANRLYPLPLERVNVNGGAVALGHPLGATGARQAVTLMYEARRRGARYGIVTMCAALGMGAAGLFEFEA